MKTIYLDNAATTYPKPPEVVREVVRSFNETGNPGRGTHRLSEHSSEIIYNCRESVARLFSAIVENIVFTMNATQALNMAIKGLVNKGDHVLIDSFAHNASYRPLAELSQRGYCTFDIYDSRDINDIENKLRSETKVLILTHQCNISSDVADIGKIGDICKQNNVKFIVDASQSAGHIPINMQMSNITTLCLPGHKGLFSPMGVGLLISADGVEYNTLIEGGAGINSLDINMPEVLPERLEAGTLPLHAISGLNAGIKYIQKIGIDEISRRIEKLSEYYNRQMTKINGVKIYGKSNGSVISFNVENLSPSVVGQKLSKHGICTRTGYHCAPLAHKTLGSLDNGSVRLSLSVMNTKREADIFFEVLDEIVKKAEN